MPKKDDQPELPKKVSDWKAPWEVDKDGNDIAVEDQELDGTRLKTYLHGLLSDKLRLRTQVNELTESRADLERQISEATDPKKIEDLQKKVDELQKQRDAATSGSALETLKLRVALRHGLTEKQSERLVGTTQEELEADAEELVSEFGGKTSKNEEVEEGGEGGEDPPEVRSVPRRLNNPTQRGSTRETGKKEMTADEFAKLYAEKQSLGYH